ncbi:hypothetical protein [Sulfitobacter sp.]|uniref:hypothetical protein n=1 Tax=Sulfitobacter sp. TaxID=1903071 RepID=UPI0032972CD4
MTVGVLENQMLRMSPSEEMHDYLMAAAKIVETISFEMAQKHDAQEVLMLLSAARDIEMRAEELKTQF